MSGSFAIGMDLGGTNARVAAVDEQGRLLQLCRKPLTTRTPEGSADALASCVAQVLAQLGQPLAACAGLGLGLAALLDSETHRVIVAPSLGWRDVDFGPLLTARIGAPVQISNDMAAAALGEAKFGGARGFNDAVLVFVGSGIGCGLYLESRVYHGHRGLSGELGHIKVRPGGRLCGCGERGCLEAYAGGLQLGARIEEAIAAGAPSSLKAIVPPGLRPTATMIDQAADEGDALAAEIRDDAATLVGVAAANLVTELNPAVLILGGGVLAGAPTFRRKVEETVRANAGRPQLAHCFIVAPALGDDAGVIGASLLARG